MDLKPFIPYLAIGFAILMLARRTQKARRVLAQGCCFS